MIIRVKLHYKLDCKGGVGMLGRWRCREGGEVGSLKCPGGDDGKMVLRIKILFEYIFFEIQSCSIRNSLFDKPKVR